jgi:catechol 2,3-dioxygenase-like lactoylglutathione lyase family enzyme
MIDHTYLPVTDVERSRAFYQRLLHSLGFENDLVLTDRIGFGVLQPGALFISLTADVDAGPCHVGSRARVAAKPEPHHVAFRAQTRDAVHAFYRAATSLGADVVHAPRLFPEYHADYFAVFVRDPDGHNIEAVCHTPA